MNRDRGLIFILFTAHWTFVRKLFKLQNLVFSLFQKMYLMNKQNTILDFEEFLNSYKDKSQANKFVKNIIPIYSNSSIAEECAYLIGKIMGDGNLDPKFTIRFVGGEKDLALLNNLIIDRFMVNPNRASIRKKVAKGVSYLLQVNCAYLGRILFLLGAPVGNKTNTEFNVPFWILSNKVFKKRFLQALLEDELTTIKIEKCNYSVRPRLKLAKRKELISNLKEFMQQVKEAIESFGIECSHISNPIKGHKTISYDLYFHIKRNKKNIMKFKEEIGFRFNQNKLNKLEECYKTIQNSLRNIPAVCKN